jgi:hypothetical protein
LLSLCAYFVQLLLVTSVIFLPSNPSRRRFSVLLAIQPTPRTVPNPLLFFFLPAYTTRHTVPAVSRPPSPKRRSLPTIVPPFFLAWIVPPFLVVLKKNKKKESQTTDRKGC